MKRFYHTELEGFRTHILRMGEKSIEQVRLAGRALFEHEPDLAQEVISRDDAIDELEVFIDGQAVRYMSLRAPVARELRLLTVGMKVSHDLERVGDEACSIAKRTIKLSAGFPVKNFLFLPEMFQQSIELLRDSIDCFLEGDDTNALKIPQRDKEIDRLNRENYQSLTDELVSQPEKAETSLHLMFISKSVERIADHAKNIAEEVVFMRRGEDVRHSQEVKVPLK